MSEKLEQESVITLQLDDGEEVDFIDIAGTEYNGNYYVILQPVELLEGMDEDEAFVFQVRTDGDGETFEIVTDDDIIDAVFDLYNKMLDDSED